MKKSFVALLAGSAVIAACFALLHSQPAQGDAFALNDISGHLPDLQFSLIDDTGRPVSEQDYRGKPVLLYFGFTGCSTQCPLTMAKLSSLLQQQKDAQVLFVSINPVNDTPPVLHHYLSTFGAAHITGLTGSGHDIEALAKRYRAAYRADPQGDIAHSNAVYIFDKDGHARLLMSPGDASNAAVHDLQRLAYD